ncbi:hypothetical protein HDU76_012834 [Blyttiomyces sp. JEL0837]|nr:hypothetical protein HDU76_012834 [Blyttiomyces sp. JEL0837]
MFKFTFFLKRKSPKYRRHIPLPPPPTLPNNNTTRRFSLPILEISKPPTPVPIIPDVAFEIIPGAEDDDVDILNTRRFSVPGYQSGSGGKSDDDGDDGVGVNDTNVNVLVAGTKSGNMVDGGGHVDVGQPMKEENPVVASTEQVSVVNETEIPAPAPSHEEQTQPPSPPVQHVGFLLPPGAPGTFTVSEDTAGHVTSTGSMGIGKSLIQLLGVRRRSTSSWMEEDIYDEAEVRTALPCSSIFIMSDFEIASPLSEENNVFDRVVVVALDIPDNAPLSWTIENVLNPGKDLVILIHVRPEVSLPHMRADVAAEIDEETKKRSLEFLSVEVNRLAKVNVRSKAVTMTGDPRLALTHSVKEFDADLLVLGYCKPRPKTVVKSLGSVSDYLIRNANCPVVISKFKRAQV